MIHRAIAKVFGTKNERELKRLTPNVASINALEPEIQKLSDDELRAKTDEFRRRVSERLSQMGQAQLEVVSPDEDASDFDRVKELEK